MELFIWQNCICSVCIEAIPNVVKQISLQVEYDYFIQIEANQENT